VRKNTASQTIAFQMNATADGSAVTTGTPTVYYTIDGGAQGTGAGASVHEGNGQWTYTPAQAETNGNHVAFTMALTNAIAQTVNVWPVSFDPTDAVRMGLTSLPNAAADGAGGLPISDAGGLDLDTLLGYLTAAVATATALATAQTDLDTITGTDGVTLATAQALYAPNKVVPDAAGVAPTAAENRAEMDSNSTQLAAIVADTNELQADDVPGLIAALNNVSVSDLLTTQMTESYAADGAAPTLAQSLMLIQQSLGDFSIAGTTITVRQVDGSTTAATFTLDDGTNPTSSTRAT